MHLNTIALFLPSLFALSGVLAQQTAEATSGAPDVTYPADDAFIFCSAQDCTGTCEVVDSANVAEGDGEVAPNDMGFMSIYWYSPYTPNYTVYTCVDYSSCGGAVSIGANACYNLYDNGVATDFTVYTYMIDGRG